LSRNVVIFPFKIFATTYIRITTTINETNKSLYTLATIVADFGDNLSPKTATVAENGENSRRFR